MHEENNMSQAPEWMKRLVDVVAASLDPLAETNPVGYRYGEDGGVWEVVTYPKPVELGTRTHSTIGFFLDLKGLPNAFDEVEAMQWFAFRRESDVPEIVIEGTYEEHQVLLRVLAEPPADDEEAGLMLDTPGKGVTGEGAPS